MTALEQLRRSLSDRYRLDREIGRGGMATVFLARDLKHDREVAIKVLHPDLSAAIPAERFHREIRIQAKLRHPHVVPLLDSGEADGLLYYIMPYVEGESLRQRLIRGPLELSEAIRIWRDVVDGIAYAHRHGIAHRDIKPENVLLADRHALVADFGVAKALSSGGTSGGTRQGETLTSVGVAIGTPAYMSPEQVSGSGDVDERSDIYSLGVLAYEMLGGKAPFTGSTPQSVFAAHISETPRPLDELRPDVPASLAATVHRCLAKEPAERWPSADVLLATIDAMATPQPGTSATVVAQRLSRRSIAAVGIAAVAVLAAGAFVLNQRQSDERWARETGLPELRRLSDGVARDSAFAIATRVRRLLPDDREVESLWRRNTAFLRLETMPAGAMVSWASYSRDTSGWTPIGATPLDSAPVPSLSLGTFVLLKLEMPGYRTKLLPLGGALRMFREPIVLEPQDGTDTTMAYLPSTHVVVADSRGGGSRVKMARFAIDRFETTNAQFKRFVDANGYNRRDLWEPFFENGRAVSWEEGIRRFVDRTGRPGPATWEGGAPAPGQERLPVAGVSWYEAMAYAKFAGKALPTVHQWRMASGTFGSAWIVPNSNTGSLAPLPVGDPRGMGPFGTFDMAGNVREWCLNTDGNRRHILGGGWSEPAWAFTHTIAEDPFDRTPMNGFRLVRQLEPEANREQLAGNVPRASRDYARERPRSEAEFRAFRGMYAYDRAPLNPAVERTDSGDTWIRQTVTFDAAYGTDRVRMHLVFPRNARPPYQTLVFGAGANAFVGGSSEDLLTSLPFLVAGGRAVAYPVLKNMYERSTDQISFANGPNNISGELLGPNTLRDQVIMMVKDLRRTVDYLETRAEIDTARLGYIGFSWGGRIGALALPVEPRFKLGVLYLAGLMPIPFRPEIDEINFLPHVRVPVLMLSGRYDDVFPLGTSSAHFFRMLGTPPAHKHQVIYETQHFLPRAEQISETLDWLDRYFGPVRR